MKYSYEYKRMCIELYRQGKWPETPEGIQSEDFRKMIRGWTRIEDSCGSEALQHRNQNRFVDWKEKISRLTADFLVGLLDDVREFLDFSGNDSTFASKMGCEV